MSESHKEQQTENQQQIVRAVGISATVRKQEDQSEQQQVVELEIPESAEQSAEQSLVIVLSAPTLVAAVGRARRFGTAGKLIGRLTVILKLVAELRLTRRLGALVLAVILRIYER